MSKFKKGDRVRVLPGGGTCLLFEGRDYDVVAVNGDDVFVRRIDRNGTDFGVAPYESERFIDAQPPAHIRTVTRREIVPGTYGYLDWKHGAEANEVTISAFGDYTAADLREAAHLFNQLAEVLEENAVAEQEAAA